MNDSFILSSNYNRNNYKNLTCTRKVFYTTYFNNDSVHFQKKKKIKINNL